MLHTSKSSIFYGYNLRKNRSSKGPVSKSDTDFIRGFSNFNWSIMIVIVKIITLVNIYWGLPMCQKYSTFSTCCVSFSTWPCMVGTEYSAIFQRNSGTIENKKERDILEIGVELRILKAIFIWGWTGKPTAWLRVDNFSDKSDTSTCMSIHHT